MDLTKKILEQLIKEEMQNIAEDENVINLTAKRAERKKAMSQIPGGLSGAEREALKDVFKIKEFNIFSKDIAKVLPRDMFDVIENDIELTPKISPKGKAPELTPKGKAPELTPKGKAPVPKGKAPFTIEKKFIPWAKRLPFVGRFIRAATDVQELLRLEQVYRRQGTAAAIIELGKFVIGLAPIIGDALVIHDLGQYLEQRKIAKAQEFVDALKTAGKGATRISAEPPPPKPSLYTKTDDLGKVPFPRVPKDLLDRLKESKLTKSKLEQLIKEVIQDVAKASDEL